EVRLDGGQRDVHDQCIHIDHEEAETRGREGEALRPGHWVLKGFLQARGIEIVAGNESRLLLREVVKLIGIKRGDPLWAEYGMDEDQVFDFSLRLADQPDSRPLEVRIENPLSNVVNPHEVRLKIERIEERSHAAHQERIVFAPGGVKANGSAA